LYFFDKKQRICYNKNIIKGTYKGGMCMKQDKYTILGLIILILILGAILGLRVLARQNDLSLEITESENTGTKNPMKDELNLDPYIGDDISYETVLAMFTEIETNVVDCYKSVLEDRTVLVLTASTNKIAGSLSDYSNTLREYKQDYIKEGSRYRITVANQGQTTKKITIVVK